MKKRAASRPRIIIDLDEHTFNRLGELIPRGSRNEVLRQLVTDLVSFMSHDPKKNQLYLGAVMTRALRLRDFHSPVKEVEDGTATTTPAELDRAGRSPSLKLGPVDQGKSQKEQEDFEREKKGSQANKAFDRGPLRQLD